MDKQNKIKNLDQESQKKENKLFRRNNKKKAKSQAIFDQELQSTSDNTKAKRSNETRKRITLDPSGPQHERTGMRENFHGYSYQVELLAVLMIKALRLGYDFRIATEVKDALGFDDIIFQCQESGTNTFRFVQLKHSSSKTITEVDITNPTGDFSVSEYFCKYQNMINAKRQLFRGEYKEFTIFTNMNIHPNLEKKYFTEAERNDSLSDFDNEKYALKSRRLILRKDTALYNNVADELRKLNKNNPDHRDIAQKLGKQVAINYNEEIKVITIDKMFTENRDWIFDTIFDLNSLKKQGQKRFVKFKGEFLNPDDNEDEAELALSEVFYKEYFAWLKEKCPEVVPENEDDKRIIKEQLVDTFFELNLKFVDREIGKDKKFALEDHEVDDFLEKIVFAVSQPDTDNLRDILCDEIDEMNIGDGGLAAGHLKTCIFDWIEDKAKFVTATDVKKLMTDIEKHFISNRLSGLGLEHRTNVLQHGCEFKQDTLIEIKNFFQSKDMILFLFYDNKLLTDIKLMQSLPMDNHSRHLFLYTKFANIDAQKGTKICPVEAFRSKADSVLLLEFADSVAFDKATDLISELAKNLSDSTNKKLILTVPIILCDEFINIMDTDALRTITYKQVTDSVHNFGDLTEETQNRLLGGGKVRIKGCEVSISHLDGPELRQWLNGDVLSQLIRRVLKFSIIDSNDQQYEEVKNYFFDRYVYRHIIISVDVLSDNRFCLWGQKGPEIDQEIILVSDSMYKYNDLCNSKSIKNAIHWLQKGSKSEYVWQKSRGSLSSLQRYSKSNKMNTERVSDLSDRVAIISGEPGMGKSTVLSDIASQSLQQSDGFYTVKTHLGDYRTKFQSMPEGAVSTEEAIKILYRFMNLESDNGSERTVQKFSKIFLINTDGSLTLQQHDNFTLDQIRLKLFTYLYNERKIVVMFDGFDEIASSYKHKVLNLLETLKQCRLHKMWVTTRPYNIQRELENRLETFSYQLVPFTASVQTEFLVKFWKRSLGLKTTIDKLEINLFLKNCLPEYVWRSRSSLEPSGFMEIPLHMWMIAVVYENRFCYFYEDRNKAASPSHNTELQNNLTIFDLYTEFFDKKFEIITKSNKYNPLFEDKYIQFRLNLQKMGLMELYSQDEVPNELIATKDWTQLVKDVDSLRELQIGLVTRVDALRPRFVHRTFAEYFAADFLADMLLSNNPEADVAKKFLYFIFTQNNNVKLITFLNYKIIKSSKHADVLNAALALDMRNLYPLENYLDYCDAFGRNPVHYIFSSGQINLNSLKTYCTSRKNDLLTLVTSADRLFKWTPIHYAIACHDCNLWCYKETKNTFQSTSFDVNTANTDASTKESTSASIVDEDCDDSIDEDNDSNLSTDLNEDWTREKVTLKDEEGFTPSLLAAKRGCTLGCFKNFIFNIPFDINVQDSEGKTVLHHLLARPAYPDFLVSKLLSCSDMQAQKLLLKSDNNNVTPLELIFLKKKG